MSAGLFGEQDAPAMVLAGEPEESAEAQEQRRAVQRALARAEARKLEGLAAVHEVYALEVEGLGLTERAELSRRYAAACLRGAESARREGGDST